MEVGHGDRRGDREPYNTADQGAAAISCGHPPESARHRHGDGHPNDPSNDSTNKKPALAGCVPDDGAGYCTET